MPETYELIQTLQYPWLTICQASVIPYITTAILRLDPESSTLTSNHTLLLRLCLLARLPRQALPILDKDIYSLPTDPQRGVDDRLPCANHELSATFITKSSNISAPLTASDVHEYYLLGAHVYIGLRRYARARLFLELVLGSPTQNVATPLMVEAYKRLILVNLLSTGSTSFTKGLINAQMVKTYSSLSKPYELLADVFRKRDVLRLDAEIDAATAVWDEVCSPKSSLEENVCLTCIGWQHCHSQSSRRIAAPVPCH
jgi:COP9 signalosome complex subunit 3